MSRAFLIAGFNNWGKTTVINELFNRCRFPYSATAYSIPGVNNKYFIVESHSNDDFSFNSYIDALKKRNGNSLYTDDLLAAFCPTRESNQILSDSFFQQFTDIYIFYLEYKWDFHAKLIINEIEKYYKQQYYGKSILHHVHINADQNYQGQNNDWLRLQQKISQIKNKLNAIP